MGFWFVGGQCVGVLIEGVGVSIVCVVVFDSGSVGVLICHGGVSVCGWVVCWSFDCGCWSLVVEF